MTLLAVLVAFALLLLFVGVLLLVAVVVLYFVLSRGDAEPAPAQAPVLPAESPRAPFPDASREPAAPPVPPALAHNTSGSLGGNLGADLAGGGGAPSPFAPEDEEVAKTEVFTRGSLNLDWDDEEAVEGATEIFRSDDFQLD